MRLPKLRAYLFTFILVILVILISQNGQNIYRQTSIHIPTQLGYVWNMHSSFLFAFASWLKRTLIWLRCVFSCRSHLG